jgi:hypothetical protein
MFVQAIMACSSRSYGAIADTRPHSEPVLSFGRFLQWELREYFLCEYACLEVAHFEVYQRWPCDYLQGLVPKGRHSIARGGGPG